MPAKAGIQGLKSLIISRLDSCLRRNDGSLFQLRHSLLTGEGKGGGESNEISIPLPFIPSREGRGNFYRPFVRRKFSHLKV
jgi:hypothetical protein